MTVHEQERQKDLNDIKTQMDSAAGRRIIWRILERGKVFSSTFSQESMSMAFLEGQRNVALELLADVMSVAPKKFQVMMLEANERKELLATLLEKEQREMIDEDN